MKLVFRTRRKRRRVVRRHLAAIRTGRRFLPLGKRREQVAARRLTADEVIRHDRMYHVLAAPLRHMAARAVRGIGVFAAGDHPIECRYMTAPARGREPLKRRLAVLVLVRIVARGTEKHAAAAPKADRLPQPVSGTDDFEFVIASGAWNMIEIQFEIGERFSRPV